MYMYFPFASFCRLDIELFEHIPYENLKPGCNTETLGFVDMDQQRDMATMGPSFGSGLQTCPVALLRSEVRVVAVITPPLEYRPKWDLNMNKIEECFLEVS